MPKETTARHRIFFSRGNRGSHLEIWKPFDRCSFRSGSSRSKKTPLRRSKICSFGEPKTCSHVLKQRLWNWVWTRDIAYATELGLSWFDTERAISACCSSCQRKKQVGDLQIVQDTGTGGNWPISTDRVTWARGAMSVLKHTDDPIFQETIVRSYAEYSRT